MTYDCSIRAADHVLLLQRLFRFIALIPAHNHL